MKTCAAILGLVLTISLQCHAQDAARQLTATSTELEKQLSTLKVSDDLNKQCTEDIAAARSALKRGHLFLALYTLQTCKLELTSLAYTASSNETFEDARRRFGLELDQKQKTLAASKHNLLPALVVALADASQAQAMRPSQSRSRAVGTDTTEGIKQLARVAANLDFAIFCRGLHLSPPKTEVKFRRITTELTKLGTAALQTYKSADFTKQQSQFDRLKSNIELAGELNSASMFEAALFKYLESQLFFGLIITTAENQDLQHLRERSKELGKLLTTGKQDQSIGVLFWQMAEDALTPVAPNNEEIKTAVVVLNRVMPSYFDYMKTLGAQ